MDNPQMSILSNVPLLHQNRCHGIIIAVPIGAARDETTRRTDIDALNTPRALDETAPTSTITKLVHLLSIHGNVL